MQIGNHLTFDVEYILPGQAKIQDAVPPMTKKSTAVQAGPSPNSLDELNPAQPAGVYSPPLLLSHPPPPPPMPHPLARRLPPLTPSPFAVAPEPPADVLSSRFHQGLYYRRHNDHDDAEREQSEKYPRSNAYKLNNFPLSGIDYGPPMGRDLRVRTFVQPPDPLDPANRRRIYRDAIDEIGYHRARAFFLDNFSADLENPNLAAHDLRELYDKYEPEAPTRPPVSEAFKPHAIVEVAETRDGSVAKSSPFIKFDRRPPPFRRAITPLPMPPDAIPAVELLNHKLPTSKRDPLWRSLQRGRANASLLNPSWPWLTPYPSSIPVFKPKW